MRIDNLTALVTGAAQGLGRCFTLELLKGGARVMAGDIQEEGLERLAADARGLPGTLATGCLDVAHEVSVKSFVGEAAQRLGPPNLLVNNAGILRDGLLVARDAEGFVRKLPTSQWKQVIDTNLTGPYLMARETVATMIERDVRPGLVVNISSITGAGNAGQCNYAAAKAGLDADTRTWALELAPYGIRVAGIAPGLTATPMAAALSADKRDEMVRHIPLGRMGEPLEIWAGLRFVIECDFFTGRVVAIDGGANYS
jgi:Dehydrogenases with different specificities (related to short-chain alcohol dehydrogenases)